MENLIRHYELLLRQGDDPFRDPPALKEYMDKWDGETFLSLLPLSPDARALEIGIGTGRLAARVLPLCARLTGIDCSPRTLERCRENLPDERLELVCADFLNWASSERFDCVYSSLTFWHFRDKRAAIEKASSLLAPGGHLVLSLGKECEERLCCFPGVVVPLNPDDPLNMQQLMREAGLTVTALRETEFAYLLQAESATPIDEE